MCCSYQPLHKCRTSLHPQEIPRPMRPTTPYVRVDACWSMVCIRTSTTQLTFTHPFSRNVQPQSYLWKDCPLPAHVWPQCGQSTWFIARLQHFYEIQSTVFDFEQFVFCFFCIKITFWWIREFVKKFENLYKFSNSRICQKVLLAAVL